MVIPSHQQWPLYPILNEVNAAAANGLPFLAIAMCLALPDICVSLASENGRTDGNGKKNSENYKDWCSANLSGPEFGFVTPDDLWSMRCGVLHNGRFGDLKHNVARVIFSLPQSPGNFVNCRINDAYVYSVVSFCKNFCDAVFHWCEANRDNENVKNNIPRLMQYRVGGLSPYIGGSTVIA
jgi:hypothetical protein